MDESAGQDVKCLEHSTLKVPYEVLNKKFRAAQKILDREAAYVAQAGADIDKLISGISEGSFSVSMTRTESERSKMSMDDDEECVAYADEVGGLPLAEGMDESSESNSNSLSLDKSDVFNKDRKFKGPNGKEVSKLLGVLVERLTSLKRKAGESIAEEMECAGIVRKRVQHLKSYRSPTTDATEWKRTRLNRMLVDHLLREGLYDSAKMLADQLDIKDLTNTDVFWAAKEVEESLKRRETSRMVAWCYENKSKLRKIRSTLELEVRVQEFVELVRKGKRFEAVKHARKYLAESEDSEHILAVRKCMGLLAFPISASAIHPYYDMLTEERWINLIHHFRVEHARLYQLASTSILGTVVQAGLAALKTPQCYRTTTKNPNCPVCSEPLSTLASNLPYAHCAHSQLVCAISGEPLNENNPPMVLPSGFVYGTKSLKEMAQTSAGKVVCSRTGRIFSHSEAERVFVM